MQEWDFVTGDRGLRLRVCGWGQAQAGRLPVVLLHGYLEQGAAWDAVAQQLPGQVLAPDHRGHGRSAWVGAGGAYHFYDYVADLDALVRNLGGIVDLVGHSMGGTIAALFAGARPDAVRRLVLIEGLGPPDSSALATEHLRGFLDGVAAPASHTPFADVAAAAARLRLWNASLTEATALGLAQRGTTPTDDGRVVWSWDPLHRVRSAKPFAWEQLQQLLSRITAPTLVVDGERGQYHREDMANRYLALPNARRVLLPGGHLLHHDAPQALAACLTEHLS